MPPRATWELSARHVGRTVHVYDAVASTNDLAAALAADPQSDGTAVLASVQTAGRGQHGRTWHAEPGKAVLLSVLLFPPPELRRPAVLTAWAAVAVAETVRRETGLPARIKWPNDVLIRDQKVCGILIESVMTTRRPPFAVAGIGLNVNQTSAEFATAGLPQATSLAAAAGHPFDADDVAQALLAELDAQYATLLDSGLTTLESLWAGRVGLLHRPAVVETASGATHCGVLRAMTFDGLELERPDGTRATFTPEGVRHLAAG